ncbi:MAG: type Z 30S ribosomal protein S14 [Candidatus Melainabacteria bacterium]
MAKTSMIVKEARRTKKAENGKFPTVKLKNRCSICGRPRAYYRHFGLCRLCLRKMAHDGKLPGVTKSSW